MAFNFDKLTQQAQRAAFAHMSKGGKAKSAVKPASPKPGAASKKMAAKPASKKMSAAKPASDPQQDAIREVRRKLREQDRKWRDPSRTVQHTDGAGRVIGRISQADAAVRMFGKEGAAARTAKANAKKRRGK